jgi:hypothetical protein
MMTDYQLPDGSWVTTAIYVGFRLPATACLDELHQWEYSGQPGDVPAGQRGPGNTTKMQMEVCKKCGWTRVRYLK